MRKILPQLLPRLFELFIIKKKLLMSQLRKSI